MAAGEKTVWAGKPGNGSVKEKIKIETSYEKARAHVVIVGIVQGVFFRPMLRSQAKILGVKGWVKNTIDGNVEAVFEGDKDQVDKMIVLCWQGPPGALVRDVKTEWKKPRHDMDIFEIK